MNPHTTSHGSYIVRDDDLDVREAAGLGFVERGQSKKSLRENRPSTSHGSFSYFIRCIFNANSMHLFSCFMPGLFVVDSYVIHFVYEVVTCEFIPF